MRVVQAGPGTGRQVAQPTDRPYVLPSSPPRSVLSRDGVPYQGCDDLDPSRTLT